jgi:Uma2 family endonuclease
MGETLIQVGPADHGRRMSLDDFEHAEAADGRRYELGRGVITVVDVPDPKHEFQLDALRGQLYDYRSSHPGVIRLMADGSGCKLLLSREQSERHPDLAIYQTERPAGKDFWMHWVPSIVVEIVSASSAYRDYEEKPEEYLRFGVGEYWIFDAEKGDEGELLVLNRAGGLWTPRIVRPPERYQTSRLPGFELNVAGVFEAAR